MKRLISICLISALLTVGSYQRGYAFDFGASAAMLVKLLAQHVQELAKLQEIVRQGKDAYRLANDVYRGINDTIRIIKSLEDSLDPGTLKYLRRNVKRIARKVEAIYGKIPNTPRAEMQKLHDQSVVDAFTRHNTIYEHHEKMKQQRKWIEGEIRRRPSPGRAAQLSAGIEYEILKAMARIEKNQAMSIKLMAMYLGQANEIEKKRSQEAVEQYDSLSDAFEKIDFDMSLPHL